MKKSDTVVDAYYLSFQGGSSDKFYEVLISENGLCILHWGRRGTSGQSSVSTMPSYQDALDLGMRQVYAKKSKGYTQQSNGKFVVPNEMVRWAREGNPSQLFAEIEERRRQGVFTGVKEAVLTHYADLAEKTQNLMHLAETAGLDEVAVEYEALEEAWAEIEDKHAEISVAMSIAKATFAKRLLGI